MRAFDPERLRRHFYTSSSCGVCGKGALEAVAVEAPPVESDLRVDAALVAALPDRLREAQPTFALTGGLHATGLFTADGELALRARGRRPAQRAWTRSSAGRSARAGSRSRDAILCVSGRLSFELVQKAALAGCPMLVAVGAPSSLAVELAEAQGVTLCGFVRGGRVSVYSRTGPRRLNSRPRGERRPGQADRRKESVMNRRIIGSLVGALALAAALLAVAAGATTVTPPVLVSGPEPVRLVHRGQRAPARPSTPTRRSNPTSRSPRRILGRDRRLAAGPLVGRRRPRPRRRLLVRRRRDLG